MSDLHVKFKELYEDYYSRMKETEKRSFLVFDNGSLSVEFEGKDELDSLGACKKDFHNFLRENKDKLIKDVKVVSYTSDEAQNLLSQMNPEIPDKDYLIQMTLLHSILSNLLMDATNYREGL